jgi:hypothetical protein
MKDEFCVELQHRSARTPARAVRKQQPRKCSSIVAVCVAVGEPRKGREQQPERRQGFAKLLKPRVRGSPRCLFLARMDFRLQREAGFRQGSKGFTYNVRKAARRHSYDEIARDENEIRIGKLRDSEG